MNLIALKKLARGIVLLGSCLVVGRAQALPIMLSAFTAKYPATVRTALDSCATCHIPAITEFVNSYGVALKDAKMDFSQIETLASPVPGKTFLDQIVALQNPGSQAADSEAFDFPARLGVVHFDHGNHIMTASYGILGNCAACHSADANHFAKVFDPSVNVKTQAHATCIECHKASGLAAAPTKCMDCHKKTN